MYVYIIINDINREHREWENTHIYDLNAQYMILGLYHSRLLEHGAFEFGKKAMVMIGRGSR